MSYGKDVIKLNSGIFILDGRQSLLPFERYDISTITDIHAVQITLYYDCLNLQSNNDR